MRRFEQPNGSFWMIRRFGRHLEVTLGKPGAPSRSTTLVVGAGDEEVTVQKLVDRQLALGYVETPNVDSLLPDRATKRWRVRFERGDEFLEVSIDGGTLYERRGQLGTPGEKREVDVRSAFDLVVEPGTFENTRRWAGELVCAALRQGYVTKKKRATPSQR